MEQLGRTTLPWESTLNALSIEELRALAAQAEELRAHPAWCWIEEAAAQKIAGLNESLLPPGVHEHAAYISVTSQIFGMRLVLDCSEAIAFIAQRREKAERLAAERAARKEQR